MVGRCDGDDDGGERGMENGDGESKRPGVAYMYLPRVGK